MRKENSPKCIIYCGREERGEKGKGRGKGRTGRNG